MPEFENTEAVAPPKKAYEVPAGAKVSMNLDHEAPIIVEGIVEGNLCAPEVRVMASGRVNGSIFTGLLKIAGEVRGQVVADVAIRAAGSLIEGDITIGRDTCQDGSRLSGSASIGVIPVNHTIAMQERKIRRAQEALDADRAPAAVGQRLSASLFATPPVPAPSSRPTLSVVAEDSPAGGMFRRTTPAAADTAAIPGLEMIPPAPEVGFPRTLSGAR